MQTFGQILKQLNKDFKHISWRGFIPNYTHDDIEDVFMGICMYENGEVCSLDGDTYSEGDNIIHYEVDKADKEFTVFHGGKVIGSFMLKSRSILQKEIITIQGMLSREKK